MWFYIKNTSQYTFVVEITISRCSQISLRNTLEGVHSEVWLINEY